MRSCKFRYPTDWQDRKRARFSAIKTGKCLEASARHAPDDANKQVAQAGNHEERPGQLRYLEFGFIAGPQDADGPISYDSAEEELDALDMTGHQIKVPLRTP